MDYCVKVVINKAGMEVVAQEVLSEKVVKSNETDPIADCQFLLLGKYYYEATVTDDGLCRVGWSTLGASLDLGDFQLN